MNTSKLSHMNPNHRTVIQFQFQFNSVVIQLQLDNKKKEILENLKKGREGEKCPEGIMNDASISPD